MAFIAYSRPSSLRNWTWVVVALFLGLLVLVMINLRAQNQVSNRKTVRVPDSLKKLYKQVHIEEQGNAGAITRGRVFAGDWGGDAIEKLRNWRSTLFTRMARAYRLAEMVGTEDGKIEKRVEPPGWNRFDVANSCVDCPLGALQRVGGDADGGKMVCLQGLLDQPGCIVYSLGSNGDFSFEKGVLQATPCTVHTLDCTYNGSSLDSSTRHFYHKVCLGAETATYVEGGEQRVYWDYPTLLLRLGHTQQRVSLLKIDIEGFEYDLLSAWHEKHGCSLPLQVAMEVHYKNLYVQGGKFPEPGDFGHLFWGRHQLSMGEVALWFSHLANLGYAVVSREDNPVFDCCAEFALLRVEQPAGCPLVSLPPRSAR